MSQIGAVVFKSPGLNPTFGESSGRPGWDAVIVAKGSNPGIARTLLLCPSQSNST
jgi:hypothetical protein